MTGDLLQDAIDRLFFFGDRLRSVHRLPGFLRGLFGGVLLIQNRIKTDVHALGIVASDDFSKRSKALVRPLKHRRGEQGDQHQNEIQTEDSRRREHDGRGDSDSMRGPP